MLACRTCSAVKPSVDEERTSITMGDTLAHSNRAVRGSSPLPPLTDVSGRNGATQVVEQKLLEPPRLFFLFKSPSLKYRTGNLPTPSDVKKCMKEKSAGYTNHANFTVLGVSLRTVQRHTVGLGPRSSGLIPYPTQRKPSRRKNMCKELGFAYNLRSLYSRG